MSFYTLVNHFTFSFRCVLTSFKYPLKHEKKMLNIYFVFVWLLYTCLKNNCEETSFFVDNVWVVPTKCCYCCCRICCCCYCVCCLCCFLLLLFILFLLLFKDFYQKCAYNFNVLSSQDIVCMPWHGIRLHSFAKTHTLTRTPVYPSYAIHRATHSHTQIYIKCHLS